MFNWLRKLLSNKQQDIDPIFDTNGALNHKLLELFSQNNQNQEQNSEEIKDLSSIKYAVTPDKDLVCEIEINTFDEESAKHLGKLFLLIEQGQVINIAVDALKMLIENNVPEQTVFVENVLFYWKKEYEENIIIPLIRPTDVFKG